MNLIAIMQPTFFPWLGYFDMIDQVDAFIFYDDVQLAKRSWQVRNRVKSANGELYLTVPIKKTKSRDDLLINESLISYEDDWQAKHLKSMESAYKKARYFSQVFPFIKDQYDKKHTYLSSFNCDIISGIAKSIGVETGFIRSSSLEGIEGNKDERLASICLKLGAGQYLSAKGSADYIESAEPGGEIAKKGVSLFYHFYEHPVYNQLYGPFVPYMGIVDLLFNEGFENALAIIRKGRKEKMAYDIYRQQFLNHV